MLYTCSLCSQDYPFLIFEYNALVCEKCSLHKNVSNCGELQHGGQLDANDPELEEEEAILIDEGDAKQLYDLIDKIDHPQMREDFMHMAAEYLQDITE